MIQPVRLVAPGHLLGPGRVQQLAENTPGAPDILRQGPCNSVQAVNISAIRSVQEGSNLGIRGDFREICSCREIIGLPQCG